MQHFHHPVVDLFLFIYSFFRHAGFYFKSPSSSSSGHQAGPSRLAPLLPERPQQQSKSSAPPRQRERPAIGDKQRRSMEEPLFTDKRAAEPASLLFASRSTSREDSGCHRRRREVGHLSSQRGASATVEADLASTIWRLLSHLQSMVSLLARTVTPSIEGKMMEKRGRATLDWATSMMVVVSHPLLIEVPLLFKCFEVVNLFLIVFL